jgi:hypothetical protein
MSPIRPLRSELFVRTLDHLSKTEAASMSAATSESPDVDDALMVRLCDDRH